MLYTFRINFLCTFYMVFQCFLYTFYIHPIQIEGQDEGQKVATRKVEDGQKTLFPEMFGDLWGVICYHHWYPRAGLEYRGSGKIIFFKKSFEIKKDAELPPEYFPPIGSA